MGIDKPDVRKIIHYGGMNVYNEAGIDMYQSTFVNFHVAKIVYALLTKHEIKMARYWPSSFLRFYGLRQSQGP